MTARSGPETRKPLPMIDASGVTVARQFRDFRICGEKSHAAATTAVIKMNPSSVVIM